MRLTWFSIFIGLLLSLAAFPVDILLPTLPGIATGLDASAQTVQMIVPIYLFAVGLGQPVYGALSDRFGRKPGLYAGLGVFLVGSVVCLLAEGVLVLYFGRLLQGLGGAGAIVVARAMVRDRFAGVKLAQTMALATIFFAVGPVLAPLFGYLIYSANGWRGVFVFLIVYSVSLLFAAYKQPETLPSEKRRSAGMKKITADFAMILKHPQSRYFVFMGGMSSSIIITYLEHTHFLYASLGADTRLFAILIALSATGIVFGQIFNHRLLGSFGVMGAAKFGALVLVSTSVMVLILLWFDRLTPISFAILMALFQSSFMIVHSNCLTMAIDPHPLRAGAASSVFGFFSFVLGALIAVLVAFIVHSLVARWALAFFILCVLVAVITWCSPKRRALISN